MSQTKVNSFIESVIGALLAAPTAQLLNWIVMSAWGDCFTDGLLKEEYNMFLWVMFFLHSIIWKFVIRRILVSYNAENLTTLIRKKWKRKI